MAGLAPVSPPLGLFLPYCNPESITLKMKERGLLHGSWTGDDFAITDTTGRPICLCKGKVMSFSGRKTFSDPRGTVLFALKDKKCALSKSFRGVGPNGEKLFKVKGHWSSKFEEFLVPSILEVEAGSCHGMLTTVARRIAVVVGSQSTIHFTNASNNEPVTLELKGDWLDRSAKVTFQGRPVATIGRSYMNFGQMFSDRQTYYVTVAPGVDLALMAAICVCLDERENDQPKQG